MNRAKTLYDDSFLCIYVMGKRLNSLYILPALYCFLYSSMIDWQLNETFPHASINANCRRAAQLPFRRKKQAEMDYGHHRDRDGGGGHRRAMDE